MFSSFRVLFGSGEPLMGCCGIAKRIELYVLQQYRKASNTHRIDHGSRNAHEPLHIRLKQLERTQLNDDDDGGGLAIRQIWQSGPGCKTQTFYHEECGKHAGHKDVCIR